MGLKGTGIKERLKGTQPFTGLERYLYPPLFYQQAVSHLLLTRLNAPQK